MADPDPVVRELLLVTGRRLVGSISPHASSGWWVVQTAQGVVEVNPALVVASAAPGVLDAGKAVGAPRRRSVAGAPGRPWGDEELRLLADAFLDQAASDKDLAQEFARTPAIIKQLRQGFEAARGNLVEDQVGEVALTWIPRWRRLLAPD